MQQNLYIQILKFFQNEKELNLQDLQKNFKEDLKLLFKKDFFTKIGFNLDDNLVKSKDFVFLMEKQNLIFLKKELDFHYFLQVTSTNKIAMNFYNENHNHYIIVAEMQTEGVGRKNRYWFSPFTQNIYLTLVFEIQSKYLQALPLTVGLALRETIQFFITNKNVQLKWSNDIFIDDCKVAGILLDVYQRDVLNVAVLGVGVNINMQDAFNINQKATSILLSSGIKVDRDFFLKLFLEKLDFYLNRHFRFGFDSVLYNRYHMLNNLIVEILENQIFKKVKVKEVSSDGSLVVFDNERGLTKINSGNINIKILRI